MDGPVIRGRCKHLVIHRVPGHRVHSPGMAFQGCQQLSCGSVPHIHLQCGAGQCQHTMRFGSTAKVLLKCKLKYYRISECNMPSWMLT